MQPFLSPHRLMVSCVLTGVLACLATNAVAQDETPATPTQPMTEAQRLRLNAAEMNARAARLELEQQLERERQLADPELMHRLVDQIVGSQDETPEEQLERDALQTQLNHLLNRGQRPSNMLRTNKPVPDWVPFAHLRNLMIFGEGFFTLDVRLVEPKLRVYFDIGSDDKGEVDLYRDGNLSVTINVLEIRITHFLFDENKLGYNITGDERAIDRSPWSWGFNFGAGIGIPAQDSEDGSQAASNAPVVLFTLGFFIEFDFLNMTSDQREKIQAAIPNSGFFSNPDGVAPGAKVGMEIGYAIGFSADENFDDVTDSAIYFGLTFHVPF